MNFNRNLWVMSEIFTHKHNSSTGPLKKFILRSPEPTNKICSNSHLFIVCTYLYRYKVEMGCMSVCFCHRITQKHLVQKCCTKLAGIPSGLISLWVFHRSQVVAVCMGSLPQSIRTWVHLIIRYLFQRDPNQWV